MNFLAECLVVVGVVGTAAIPCSVVAADSPPGGEPTLAHCVAAVEEARSLAMALPSGDLSRYFAERHLHQAMIEAGNGEFDDCLEWAARASEEVRERRHALPGEMLKVLRADQ
jgi:hypothetical protein